MKNLLIMRHGEPQRKYGLNDFDLPLSDKGEKAAAKKGEIIFQKGAVPDVILSSPAMRAKTTAELVAKSCGYEGEIIFHKSFYTNGCDSIITTIRELPDSINRVLLIGHNPAWTDLVYALPSRHKMVPMNPATLVALVFKGNAWKDIDPGKCVTEWVI